MYLYSASEEQVENGQPILLYIFEGWNLCSSQFFLFVCFENLLNSFTMLASVPFLPLHKTVYFFIDLNS